MTIFGWARRRLGVQLLLVMTFVSLAPLAGAGLLLLKETESSIREQVRSHHDRMTEVSTNLIQDYMGNAKEKLQIIAHFLSRRSYEDPKELTRDLKQRLESAGIFLDLNYYQIDSTPGYGFGRKGTYANQAQESFNRAQTAMGGSNLYDPRINPAVLKEPFVLEARRGRPFVSPRLARLSDIPYVVLSVPIARGGKTFAVLAANLDFRPVARMLRHVAGTGRAIDIRSGGRTILASGLPLSGARIETVRAVGHADWKVRVREEEAQAFAPLHAARRQSILWLAAAAALALFLSALLSARILRPIRSLTKTAEAVGAGDLEVRTGILRHDEIGRLARQFDRMTASLRELDRLKSDFVSHVSHELRTPLTSAKLSLANLADEVLGPMTPKQKQVADRIRQDMDRLIHMVNELLDIARLEAGKVELLRERVDLAGVVSASAETIRPLAEAKEIRLDVSGEPAAVEGDRAKLHEVVLNLLDNAVKFTPAGGRVAVVLRAHTLTVEDTGPGLSEYGAHLFEKFAPRRPGTPGVGLGLSITKKLVELHGGSIRGEDRAEGGARFTVVFPSI